MANKYILSLVLPALLLGTASLSHANDKKKIQEEATALPLSEENYEAKIQENLELRKTVDKLTKDLKKAQDKDNDEAKKRKDDEKKENNDKKNNEKDVKKAEDKNNDLKKANNDLKKKNDDLTKRNKQLSDALNVCQTKPSNQAVNQNDVRNTQNIMNAPTSPSTPITDSVPGAGSTGTNTPPTN